MRLSRPLAAFTLAVALPLALACGAAPERRAGKGKQATHISALERRLEELGSVALPNGIDPKQAAQSGLSQAVSELAAAGTLQQADLDLAFARLPVNAAGPGVWNDAPRFYRMTVRADLAAFVLNLWPEGKPLPDGIARSLIAQTQQELLNGPDERSIPGLSVREAVLIRACRDGNRKLVQDIAGKDGLYTPLPRHRREFEFAMLSNAADMATGRLLFGMLDEDQKVRQALLEANGTPPDVVQILLEDKQNFGRAQIIAALHERAANRSHGFTDPKYDERELGSTILLVGRAGLTRPETISLYRQAAKGNLPVLQTLLDFCPPDAHTAKTILDEMKKTGKKWNHSQYDLDLIAGRLQRLTYPALPVPENEPD